MVNEGRYEAIWHQPQVKGQQGQPGLWSHLLTLNTPLHTWAQAAVLHANEAPNSPEARDARSAALAMVVREITRVAE